MLTAISSNGILGKLVATGAQFMAARAAAAKPAKPALAASSALRSQRIRLRILRSENRFQEIIDIAAGTGDAEVIRAATRELSIAVEENEDAVTPFLIQLAQTKTTASLSAIIVLLNVGAVTEANNIFRRKTESGELESMLANGTASFFHTIDIASFLDRAFKKKNTVPLFNQMLAALPLEKQAHALAELFGDTEPGGYRYPHDQNGICSEIKMLALEWLMKLPAEMRVRPLWYATREKDDTVAYNATIALMAHWQGEGRVPPHLDPFPMLDIPLLFYLTKLAANFRWRSEVDLNALHERERELVEELEQAPPNSHAAKQLEGRLENLAQQMQRETEARLKSLQPIVNEITKALHLPYAMLEPSDEVGFAAYALGTGRVLLNRRTILDERPLGEDVMSSLLHELCHMGQDVLLISKICDDLNLVFGQHGKLLISLWDRYSDIMGYAPDHVFLLAILRLRNDVRLTGDQAERVQRLLAAANMTNVTHHQKKYIGTRMAHLMQSKDALATGDLDGQLLGVLRDLQQLQGMFDAGQIPEVLLFELQKCQQELHALAQSFVQAGWFAPNKDWVAIAEQLYASEHRRYVEYIAVKVRKLLLETLDEELEALYKMEGRLVRMGYHEDEAYEISWRVEVIVKAILKGWYA